MSVVIQPHCQVITPESMPLYSSVSRNHKQVVSHNLLSCLIAVEFDLNVKVKFTLEQATKAQMGTRGIALLFL
jgi:hypothetical protein